MSHDFGRTWSKPASAHWPNRRGKHPFQLGAFARQDDHVYLDTGTPNGRFGAGCLARVDQHRVADVADYRYWTAVKVKTGRPEALIAYVRQRNERGDTRHPVRQLNSENP